MTSYKLRFRSLFIGALAVLGLAIFAVGKLLTPGTAAFSAGEAYTINPAFANYISSFTSGFVSSGSTIQIRLSNEYTGVVELNKALSTEYFKFSPSIPGHAVWRDAQTLEFIPSEALRPGQTYAAYFHLGKVVEVPEDFQEFEFRFQVIQQSLQLSVNDLKSYHSRDYEFYSLTGLVSTADKADPMQLEKTLSSVMDNKSLRVKWTHNDAGVQHTFLIDSIRRPASGSASLHIQCDGQVMGLSYTANEARLVPEKGKFELLNVKTVSQEDPYILLNFSNPVEESKSLEGLITVKGLNEVKYLVTHNQVMIYPQKIKTGTYILQVNEGVTDTKGTVLGISSEHSIVFSEAKPEVRFVGDGTILPSSTGLSLPFETVNLRAVDVTIVKIYANNVLQFLQNNTFDGQYQLSHVGKKVLTRRINLGIQNPSELNGWKRSALDLSSLIKTEQGAIYRVSISFRKEYASYPCLGNSEKAVELERLQETDNEEEEVSYFNGRNYEYDYYYYYNEDGEYEEYNWEDRDNPCKAYYYKQSERTVSKNVLASDLGITLKRGNDGSLFVVANDLVNTQPLERVQVELYDFQKQLIQTAATNSDGQVFISPQRAASFLVAKHGKNFAYLRIADGEALSLSMFDVDGSAIKKGLKGFIYGERGVWRPGDSLYLNFILEDKAQNIPADHPVSMTLVNPQGQIYKRMVLNKTVDGFYNFATATDANAPTGFWNVEVKVGSVKFNKSIRIETIMPNRLKIELRFANEKVLSSDVANTIQLHTNWLTGAVAKNLDVKMNVALTAGSADFPKFKEYVFEDVTRSFEAQNISVFEGKVDEQGNASIPVNIQLENSAPGMLRAAFNTMVFEPGGAFSVDRYSMDYSPYHHYVGLKVPAGERYSGILYTGREHVFQLASVDAAGNPISRQNIKYEVFKLQWRWWWDSYNYDLANYASDQYHQAVKSEVISTKNGKASFSLSVAEENWGRYLVRVTDLESGHRSSRIVYFDWSNWMERGGGSDAGSMSNMLSFSTDKPSYKVGEEVKVTLPTPQNGRALVTIENGTRVMEAHWLETQTGTTLYKFKVTPQMAPNVYVHVALIQPHERTNDLPIRLYGAVPVMVDDPETHLAPVITLPDVIEPEKMVNIEVKEEKGREMAFTLAMVDEGLLDITRFKTPDPHPAFYTKEALGVKTWDVYDRVIGAFGADLERILSIGGDGSELGNDGAKANRFKPMVRFFGPFYLKKGEKKNIRFNMPMYVGSVRTMVIAAHKGSYGKAEKTTPVKAPLMLLGTLPRVLSITEEVKLPVSVFGGEKAIGKTEVKVEVNGLLQVTGGTVKTVSVARNEEKLVLFDLKVKSSTGIAKVKITASGGGHTATYDMELDVRNPSAFETRSELVWLEAGKSLEKTLTPFGQPGSNSGAFELSSIPPLNMDERLRYLITYPHGCLEQTTSKCFGQVYLGDVLDLSAARRTNIEYNLKEGIRKLADFQLSSGGFAYWPGSTEAADWATSYAGHFLLVAERKGYTLPPGLKKNWINYQQGIAQSFVINKSAFYNSDELQAYRLYVLALANNPVMGAMNRLREFPNLSIQARWLLAAAYAQVGQTDEASKLVAGVSKQIPKYAVNYYTYGSTERDMAIVLQTLCLLNRQNEAFAQLKDLSEVLSADRYLSTQSTAFALMAVSEFVIRYGTHSALQAKCTLNGQAQNLGGKASVAQLPLEFKNNGAERIKVENFGKGLLALRLVNRGQPMIGNETEAADNISVGVEYRKQSGEAIDPGTIEQGSSLLVSITVRNLGVKGALSNIALSAFVPSGWEINNSRLDDNEAVLKNSAYDYQDIRDDRVSYYFDLRRDEAKTFSFMVTASYQGRFYLPGVNVEAMYDNTVFARKKGQWIRIVKN